MPDFSYERRFGFPLRAVLGVDEVGRGCLAGPVVAAAVLLPKISESDLPNWIGDVDDSKKLSASLREKLDREIRGWVSGVGIGAATVSEIDEINIYHAAHLAMKRAIQKCAEHAREQIPQFEVSQATALIDGNAIPRGLTCATQAIIKGDQKSIAIACASIVAKVWRDRLMGELDIAKPGYLFAKHKGYATAEHQRALNVHGISEHHRKTFEPVKSMFVALQQKSAGMSLEKVGNHSLDDSLQEKLF